MALTSDGTYNHSTIEDQRFPVIVAIEGRYGSLDPYSNPITNALAIDIQFTQGTSMPMIHMRPGDVFYAIAGANIVDIGDYLLLDVGGTLKPCVDPLQPSVVSGAVAEIAIAYAKTVASAGERFQAVVI